MSSLIEFYKQVLDFANLHADTNGYVRSNGGEKSIITVENRLMVLPIREHFRSLTPDKEVFHPLAENTLTRLSKAMETYIYRLNGNLNTRFAELASELKFFCCSPKKQLNMTSAQLAIVRGVEGEEDTTADDSFEKFLMQQLGKNPSGAFLNIALARGGLYKGQKKSRVGFVTFPLYKKLKEDLGKPRKDSEFPTLKKKHLELLIQLHEAIFPGLDIPEEYNFGFESGIAPFFTTLMQTAGGVADALNLVLETFQSDFASEDFTPLNLSWRALLDNQPELSKLAKAAPNTETDAVYVGVQERQTAKAPTVAVQPEPVAAKPTPAAPAAPDVPFMGGPGGMTNQQAQPARGYGRPQANQTGRERIPFDQWKNTSASPSQLSATGTVMEAIRRYNEGYAEFYMQHIQRWNMPPANMPHPGQIPPNQPAPLYPGAPPLPMVPGVNAPMAPPPTQWGQPQQQWGQPQQQQWGRPQQQQGWGQPQQQWQQPQQQQWGQPQQNWGQQQQNWGNQAQNTHSGTVFQNAI